MMQKPTIRKRPLTPKKKRHEELVAEPTMSDVETLKQEAKHVIRKAVANATIPLTPKQKMRSPQKPPPIMAYPSIDYRQSIPAKTGQLKRKELMSDDKRKLLNLERQRELIAAQMIFNKNKLPELPLLQRDIREIEEKVKQSDHWKKMMENTIAEPEMRFLRSLRDPEFEELLKEYQHVDASQKERSQKILSYVAGLDESLEDDEHQQIFMEKLLDPPDVRMKSRTQLMLSKSKAKAQTSTPYKRSVLQKKQPFRELPTVLEDQNRVKNKYDRKKAIEHVRHKKIEEFKSKFPSKRSNLIGTLEERKLAREQAEFDKFDEESRDFDNELEATEMTNDPRDFIVPELPDDNLSDTPTTEMPADEYLKEDISILNEELENAQYSPPKTSDASVDVELKAVKCANYFRMRGSQTPSWFKGFYTAYPVGGSSIQCERTPSDVVVNAWRSLKPTLIQTTN